MEMLTNTNLVVVSATFMAFTAAMWAAMSVIFHDSTRKPEHRLSDLVNPQTNPGQPLSLLKEEPFSLEGLLRIGLPVGSIFRRWAKRF